MSAEQLLCVPQGDFTLQRYPYDERDTLRAWDAADEYLLNHLAEQFGEKLPVPMILNDNFGALSVALGSVSAPVESNGQPNTAAAYFNSDSFIAHQALVHNLKLNQLNPDNICRQTPFEHPVQPIQLLVIKIPKTLALLEDQLHRIREHLAPNCTIVAAAMAKHIHRSTLELFERIVGPTTTSLAKKKARLVFAKLDPALQLAPSPYPSQYQLENSRFTINNHAGVFSREKLDIGTRLFLQHLPESDHGHKPQQIIDLGCGNGAVGLMAAECNPNAEVIFVDESYRALESARQNFTDGFGQQRQGRYIADNCLDSFVSDSADLILNNPPFHQQQAVGDHIARQMFSDAKRVLRRHGQLWVIGNRHLGYHVQLKKLFGNCELVASNAKFVVLKAVKV
ncbi:MAG: methyltransferase [Motiliproteus sp.]